MKYNSVASEQNKQHDQTFAPNDIMSEKSVSKGYKKIVEQNRLILKVFAACLLITFVFYFIRFLARDNHGELEEAYQGIQGTIQVENSQGTIVMLPYSKPAVFKTKPLPEPELTIIQYEYNESFMYYLKVLGPAFEFSNRLYMNWLEDKPIFFQAEFHLLSQKYDMKSYKTEKKICIVAPLTSMATNATIKNILMFMRSLDGQNYSNYKVFMLEDIARTNETQLILNQSASYPRFNNRLQIIRFKDMGDLGMKDYTIRTYCQSGDIILELSAEGSLIGKQALNVMNRFYQNASVWFVYANYIWIESKEHNPQVYQSSPFTPELIRPGTSQKIQPEILKQNSYRGLAKEYIKSPVTYLRDLYYKIPLTHLLSRGTNRYYQKSSSLFINSALVQLAGAQHTYFYPDYLYLSTELNQEIGGPKNCATVRAQKNKYQAFILTPLKTLRSLQDEVKIKKTYIIPEDLMRVYVQKDFQQKVCMSRQKGHDKIFMSGGKR